MFDARPVERSSRMTTSKPRSRNKSTTWEPMKPAPPVTSIFAITNPLWVEFSKHHGFSTQPGWFETESADRARCSSSECNTYPDELVLHRIHLSDRLPAIPQ